MNTSKPDHTEEPVDQMKPVNEVDVFGPTRVTQAFLPLLKASATARIVMMTSGLGSLAAAVDPASEFHAINLASYNTSKAVLKPVAVAFAKELLQPLGFKVDAAEPGYTVSHRSRGARGNLRMGRRHRSRKCRCVLLAITNGGPHSPEAVSA